MQNNESDTPGSLPFEAQTPISLAGAVLGRLEQFFDELAEQTGGKAGQFIDVIFKGMWDDGNTGEEQAAEFDKWDEQPEELQPLGIIQAAFVACGYAIDALKAPKDSVEAWRFVASAKYWLGITVGAWSIRREQETVLRADVSSRAKLAAASRHAENHAMRQQVLDWFANHGEKYRSKDKAAEAIAGRVVPLSFRTVRDYLAGIKRDDQ
jgi:hypothetical protein